MNDLYTCDYCGKNLDRLKNVYVSGDLSAFCSKNCAEKHEYKDISKMSMYDYENWTDEVGNCQFCQKNLRCNKNVYITKDLSVCCSKNCAKNHVESTIGKISMHKYMSDYAQYNGY